MKIRIKGNHLRFRLRQPDVAALHNKGMVIEKIEFGENENEQISFALCVSADPAMSINYEFNKVNIFIPKNLINEWINTVQVGIEADIDTGKSRTIAILIEKDFACLDAADEDNEGAYPNPLINCQV
jgi:hypothetical protein